MRPKLNLRDELEQMFEKKFQYNNTHSDLPWVLPKPDQPLFSEFYQYSSLQALKERLNTVKSKLNGYSAQEWSAHTNRRDPSGGISWRLKNETKAEFVTVAWCKFFECLHRYPLVKQPILNTLHLCEAPGAFITALNHYLHSTYKTEEIKWRWASSTLNPYYEGNSLDEMITDDRLIYHTMKHWLFHSDFTGNLINVANIDHMTEMCAHIFSSSVQLITADGSIDCAARPDCQEEIVARLLIAEILSALTILSMGGNFIIKMFTLFESCSVSILYMLNCTFQQVHIYKPTASKRGNSEVYIICINFQKNTPHLPHLLQKMRSQLDQRHDTVFIPIFAKSQISSSFLMQHEIACRLYMQLQSNAIIHSIYAYESKDRQYIRHLHRLRCLVSAMYYNRYKVQPLPREMRIVKEFKTSETSDFRAPKHGDSYTERESLKHDNLLYQIYCLRRELNELVKCSKCTINYTHEYKRTIPLVLALSKGLPITKLQSSLFVSEHIFKLRFRILFTLNRDPIWQIAQKCCFSNGKEITYLPVAVEEPYYKTQQQFFLKLLEMLLELKPKSIVFHKFVFLTHFAASVLLFLMETLYRKTEFDNNLSALTITLSDILSDGMEQIRKLIVLIRSDANIHSVVDIQLLHKNIFNNTLMQQNNETLLSSYRSMLGEESFPTPVIAEPLPVHPKNDIDYVV